MEQQHAWQREATQRLNAARKAKHDAPHASRILFDPFTFGPTATYAQNVEIPDYPRGAVRRG
jgi:hypothetical protein